MKLNIIYIKLQQTLIPLVISAIIFLYAGYGCVGINFSYKEEGKPVDTRSISRIKIGHTDEEEALYLLGAPSEIKTLKNGQMLLYKWKKKKEMEVRFGLPGGDPWYRIIHLQYNKNKEKESVYGLIFDKTGILKGVVIKNVKLK